jgi:energy-coupling factor transporter ATP-binding protein EcfA2
MTMQLGAIVLYHNDGRKRILEFKPGRVNIITGDSAKGKSTLIDIIEYCLGQDDFKIKFRPEIRDLVAWYGVLYQLDDRQIFIAKHRPEKALRRRTTAYYEEGNTVVIPEIDDLHDNTSDEAIIQHLSTLIGITSNEIIPGEGRTGSAYNATIRHTIFYLYQPDHIISSPDALFFRQSEPEMARTIRDTLPFFLGAVTGDYLRLKEEWRQLRRELRIKQRDIEEREDLTVQSANIATTLLAEAQQVGLVETNVRPETEEETRGILRNILGQREPAIRPYEDDQINGFRIRLEELRQVYAETQERIDIYQSYERDATEYTGAARDHVSRLATVNVFNDEGGSSNMCPLCGTELHQSVPTADAIRASLEHLRVELEAVQYKRPALQGVISELQKLQLQTRQEIQQIEQDLQSLLREKREARRVRDLNVRTSHSLGRISLFLEIVPERRDEFAELQHEIKTLERKLRELEKALDSSEIEDRLDSILFEINTMMTGLAHNLPTEYREGIFRLDLRALTVMIYSAGEMIRLDRTLGSTRNRLYAHLVALFSLRHFFVIQHRPIPGFLILDQPSVAFYPDDTIQSRDFREETLTDTDRDELRRVFSLMFDICEELFPDLQIIVLEHANFPEPQFQAALVDRPWRGEQGLVPSDWLFYA